MYPNEIVSKLMWVAGDFQDPNPSTVEHVCSLLVTSLRKTYNKSLESSDHYQPKPYDLFMSMDNEIEEYGAIRFLKEKKSGRNIEASSGTEEDLIQDEEDKNKRKRSRDSYEGKDEEDDESEDEDIDEDISQKTPWNNFAETEAKRINILTKQMTLEEYFEFHEARVNSLVSYKKKDFCEWVGIPSNTNSDYLLIMGWLSIFRIKNFVISAIPLKEKRIPSQGLFPVIQLTKSDFGVEEICKEALPPAVKTKERMISTIDFIHTLTSKRISTPTQKIVKSHFWKEISSISST